MVKRCIFPPLSPIANGGNCTWSEHDTYPTGVGSFAPIPHLPPATATVVAANTARTAALRQREAQICGWLARLLWLGLHVGIIAITCATNPLVAARLRHDMPYTLGLAFILAVNLTLYVSLCTLDPGFIPRDLQQLGRAKGGKEGTERGNIIQLSPWKYSCRGLGHNPRAETLPVKGIQGHIHPTLDAGDADPTFLSVSPSERSGSPYPPLPPPFLLPPSPHNQNLVSPDVCGRIESQQGPPVESRHIQQQHKDPSGSCGVASLGTLVGDTAHLGTSTPSHQYVQDPQNSPKSFGSKDRGVSATVIGPEDYDPEQQSLLSPSGDTSAAAASSVDGGGCVGWCSFCKVGQPLYSKHCHDCGRCVMEFDHHCAWLGTCVGARNRCRFWWFLLVQTAVLGWGTAETAVAIPRQGFGTHVAHPLRAILLLWATFTCCLLMVITAGLLVFNLYLGGKGMTMYQFMRSGARQVGNTSAEEVDKSVISKACVSDTFKNLRRFCCPRSCSRVFELY